MSTLTLQDVADLAKVRRPVVSMWRKRPSIRGVSMPFPDPVATVDGVARFSQTDIVEWLNRTGRGNNVEHDYDAPAIAVPDGVALEDAVTLLCWHALTGEELEGTSLAQRIRRAAEFDPDDVVVLREIRELQASDDVLAYIDDLVEASFGLPDALMRLECGPLKRVLRARDLTREAGELLHCVLRAGVAHIEAEQVVLRAEGWPAALDVAEAGELEIASSDRMFRRRALIRGIPVRQPATRARVSAWSLVGLDIAESLDRADEIVLGLNSGDVAMLLGPSAALADALPGPLQTRRAGTLRVANVVAAIRLPRGMWREAHRQNLAVWVCLGRANAQQPWIADLEAVDHLDLTDLAADAAGALAQTEDRGFRYARRTDLVSVLAGAPVVPRGVRAPRLRSEDTAVHLDRVHSATLVTTVPLEPLDVLVAPSPGRMQLRYRSLGELHDRNHLVVKRGRRINPAHASPDGTVKVLPVELVGSMSLDPFDAEQKYPRAARTEPGDVIFVEKPIPRAWVDSVGGAMVASPARIFRLQDSAEVGPMVLATIINGIASPRGEWKTWNVPVLRREETERLEKALVQADEFEREARRRCEAARDLKTALIDGVAAGALTLDTQPTTPGVAAARK